MRNPLLDYDFLRKLDAQTDHETFAKIISLNLNEDPIEEISGKITQGSINIDGESAVRRTCTLSLIAHEVNINEFYWGLNTKFKLEIGLRNNIDSRYEDIIWFEQGIYLISSFNVSYNTNSYSISISGKDKMCLLNGDIAGVINSLTADFGTYDEIDADGNTVTYDYPLKEIILEAVHQYAGEPYHKIMVNDLDDQGFELIEYRGDTDIFFLIDKESTEVTNIRFNDASTAAVEYYIVNYDENTKQYINSYEKIKLDSSDIIYDTFSDLLDSDIEPTYITPVDSENTLQKIYTVVRVTYGDTCGYRLTELTYAGDLIGSIGSSITSIFDKIVSMLGDYEYFYDIKGIFHFQRKHTYINKSWNNIINNRDEIYADSAAYSSAVTYSFIDSNLITAYQNTPDLANLKNDYSIWGEKNTSSDSSIPILMRYAIDNKPKYYKAYDGTIYLTEDELISIYQQELESETITTTDDISYFKVTALPAGLSSEWWEIDDWARRYLYYADVNNEHSASYYLNLTSENLVEIISQSTLPTTGVKDFNYYCYQLKSLTLPNFISGLAKEEWLTIFPHPAEITSNQYYDVIENARKNNQNLWCALFDTGLTTDNKEYIKSIVHGYKLADSSIDSLSITTINCFHKFSYALSQKSSTADPYYHSYIYNPSFPDEIKELTNNTEKSSITTGILSTSYKIVDWREIIYQMASDYYKYYHDDDFLTVVANNNPDYYPLGKTGYEYYYIDIQGFWRLIYNPNIETIDLNNFNITDSSNYYIWNENEEKFDTYTFRQASSILDLDTSKTYYYFNGTITLDNLVAIVQSYQNNINIATSEKDKKKKQLNANDYSTSEYNALISKIDTYYNTIIKENTALLNQTNNGYIMSQFLNLDNLNENQSIKDLVAAFYPTYKYISDTLWRKYEAYVNFNNNTNYYSYEYVKDLTALSETDTYYTYNESSKTYNKYTTTAQVDDITSDIDVLGNYSKKKSVPSFTLGNKYYLYKGYEKVSSLESGNTYYSYEYYKPAQNYNSSITYYTMTSSVIGDQTIYFFTEVDNINTNNITNYYYKPDSVSTNDLTIKKGYCFKVIINSSTTYYTIDRTITTFFTRGQSYYYEDGTFAFEFERGTTYYVYKGYEKILDLSDLSKNNYYYELDSNELVTSLSVGKIYYGYILQNNNEVENGIYYIYTNGKFNKINLLKKYRRGSTYYIYSEDFDLINSSDFDSNKKIYIKNLNTNVYTLIDTIVTNLKGNSSSLSDTQITTLASKYGIKVNANGTIYGLSNSYNFYIKESDYHSYNYYKFTFYSKANQYNSTTQYYKLSGNDYEYVGLINSDTFYKGTYYIKLDNATLKVYLTNEYNPNTGWTMTLNQPEDLIFWFDFLDLDNGSELSQYAVNMIGDRPKTINDSDVKAIYYRDTPTVIFCNPDGTYIKTFINNELYASHEGEEYYYEKDSNGNYYVSTEGYSANKDYYRRMTAEDKQTGYTYIYLNESVEDLFSISSQGKTAMDMVNNFLYNYSYCTQSITLTAIPIYYLQPNTRIFVHDDNSGIDGEYLLTKISYSLQYNGTMSMTATKAVDRII